LLLVPPFPLFPEKLMLTKCRNNHHFITPSVLFPSGCKTLLLPFRFPSGFPYSLSVSVPPPFRSLHSYIGNAFHKHTPGAISICPTPLRITALPRKLAKEQRRYRESLASSISNIFNINSANRTTVNNTTVDDRSEILAWLSPLEPRVPHRDIAFQ